MRWPWTTCPDAAGPLHALDGMPLSPRCLAVGDVADPKQQCTHMFDLAGLAVAHAARGGPGARPASTTSRSRAPREGGNDRRARAVLRRDGEPVLTSGRSRVDAASRPSRTRRAVARRVPQWADETFDPDEAEAAIVLRRACDIGMGRGMDLDAVDRAAGARPIMPASATRCSPRRSASRCATRARIRDFDGSTRRAARGRTGSSRLDVSAGSRPTSSAKRRMPSIASRRAPPRRDARGG